MSIKITDNKGVNSSTKKKTNKSNAASGVSFDALVNAASTEAEVAEVPPTAPVAGVHGGAAAPTFYEEVPAEPKARGAHILELLEELHQDVLSGNPTIAVQKLKEALATGALKKEDLPQSLQHVLDEIDMRASVEIAKMEEGQ